MKSLIVDDVSSTRAQLKHILMHFGECTTAVDGREALTLFKEQIDAGTPFDLVMMDIMMPQMDGQEALMEIRRLEKKKYGSPVNGENFSCIIMQTCLDDPKDRVESFFKGKCNGYLIKPIDKSKLIAELVKFI